LPDPDIEDPAPLLDPDIILLRAQSKTTPATIAEIAATTAPACQSGSLSASDR
jgi:hypothetical protein